VRLSKQERASAAGKVGGRGRPKDSLLDTVVNKLSKGKSKKGVRAAVAKHAGVSERKVRNAGKLERRENLAEGCV